MNIFGWWQKMREGGPDPGAPAVSVRREAGRTIISWPSGFPEYRLQFTTHPEDPSTWADWLDPVVTIGAETFAAFPSGSRPMEFYRLRRLP